MPAFLPDAMLGSRLLGASAGVFGILVGVAVIEPDMKVRLLFPPVTMKMRTMAIGFLCFESVMLLANLALVFVAFKELMITTFDPQLAGALGFRPRLVHYCLITVTTATLVTAFEGVGSILVIGMLVIPPATAFFVVRRFGTVSIDKDSSFGPD